MGGNAATARRLWEEIFTAMDLDAVEEVVSPDAVDHTARPGEPHGIEGVRNTMRFLDAAFSGQRFEVHQTIEEGDTVAIHFTHRGRHTGEIMGIGPTNREFAYQHIHILRFEGGKIVEHWGVHDHLGFIQQIGALPPKPQAVTEGRT